MVAAGYIVYGSGTVLVLATEFGVNGFTLDPTVGEFFLSHRDIRIPASKTYSCNEAYSPQWERGIQSFLDEVKSQGWRARYIGSLVADFHRNLIKGGTFMYPATAASPQGKLRLLYEGFPLAFIAEAAGGAAHDGTAAILDRVPTELHERVPLFIGSADGVQQVAEHINSHRKS